MPTHKHVRSMRDSAKFSEVVFANAPVKPDMPHDFHTDDPRVFVQACQEETPRLLMKHKSGTDKVWLTAWWRGTEEDAPDIILRCNL